MVGVWVLLAAVIVAVAVGAGLRARDGVFRTSARADESAAAAPGPALVTPAALPSQEAPVDFGAPLGQRATLVQFSSAFCAPCRTTRTLLADITNRLPGVSHIEVDAEHRLDLTRQLGIRRTPTVLILDAAGREVRRASGAPPRRAAVLAILAAAGVTGAAADGDIDPERPSSADR